MPKLNIDAKQQNSLESKPHKLSNGISLEQNEGQNVKKKKFNMKLGKIMETQKNKKKITLHDNS